MPRFLTADQLFSGRGIKPRTSQKCREHLLAFWRHFPEYSATVRNIRRLIVDNSRKPSKFGAIPQTLHFSVNSASIFLLVTMPRTFHAMWNFRGCRERLPKPASWTPTMCQTITNVQEWCRTGLPTQGDLHFRAHSVTKIRMCNTSITGVHDRCESFMSHENFVAGRRLCTIVKLKPNWRRNVADMFLSIRRPFHGVRGSVVAFWWFWTVKIWIWSATMSPTWLRILVTVAEFSGKICVSERSPKCLQTFTTFLGTFRELTPNYLQHGEACVVPRRTAIICPCWNTADQLSEILALSPTLPGHTKTNWRQFTENSATKKIVTV